MIRPENHEIMSQFEKVEHDRLAIMSQFYKVEHDRLVIVSQFQELEHDSNTITRSLSEINLRFQGPSHSRSIQCAHQRIPLHEFDVTSKRSLPNQRTSRW